MEDNKRLFTGEDIMMIVLFVCAAVVILGLVISVFYFSSVKREQRNACLVECVKAGGDQCTYSCGIKKEKSFEELPAEERHELYLHKEYVLTQALNYGTMATFAHGEDV